jgi:Phage integrase, N-terminal SAM-like domain
VPRGAAVIRYQGKRGAVWRLQYRDAAGRYVKETLGREPPWNRTKAERELGKRLADVEDGYRKPDELTFSTFRTRFEDEYLPGRNLKPTTLENYRYILDRHLVPHFGRHQLSELEKPRTDRRLHLPQGQAGPQQRRSATTCCCST